MRGRKRGWEKGDSRGETGDGRQEEGEGTLTPYLKNLVLII